MHLRVGDRVYIEHSYKSLYLIIRNLLISNSRLMKVLNIGLFSHDQMPVKLWKEKLK